MISKQITIATPNTEPKTPNTITYDPVFSAGTIRSLLDRWAGEYLLLILPGGQLEFGERTAERFLQVANDTGAAWLYSDFRQQNETEVIDHPLIDYQPGSIRDNFDFGSVLLLSRRAVDRALGAYGRIEDDIRWGGLYDLRLKLSVDSEILRIPEPLYTRSVLD